MSACTESRCNSSSIWTGPVLSAVSSQGLSTVQLRFEDFSAEGMKLKDVRSTNPDGTTNNCTRCCKGNPPFEISSDYDGVNTTKATWTKISQAQTTVAGSTVSLKMSGEAQAAGTVTGVRYAWSDFVDCVLVNSDGLPAGPFVEKIAAAEPAPALAAQTDEQKVVVEAPPPPIPASALSPPMVSHQAKRAEIPCTFSHFLCG